MVTQAFLSNTLSSNFDQYLNPILKQTLIEAQIDQETKKAQEKYNYEHCKSSDL